MVAKNWKLILLDTDEVFSLHNYIHYFQNSHSLLEHPIGWWQFDKHVQISPCAWNISITRSSCSSVKYDVSLLMQCWIWALVMFLGLASSADRTGPSSTQSRAVMTSVVLRLSHVASDHADQWLWCSRRLQGIWLTNRSKSNLLSWNNNWRGLWVVHRLKCNQLNKLCCWVPDIVRFFGYIGQ